MILKEAREQALRAFNTSIDVNVLTKAINDYDEFKTAKWLDQDGKRHLFALVSQLKIKRELILYFNNGCKQSSYEDALKLFEKMVEEIVSYDLKNTNIMINRATEMLKECHKVLLNLDALEGKMRDSFGQRKLHNVSEFEPIIEKLKEKLEEAKCLRDGSIFSENVVFVNIKEQAINKITSLIEYADKACKDIDNSLNERFFYANAKKIEDVINKYYVIGPLIDFQKEHFANTLVVNSPILPEVRLLALKLAKNINCELFEINANAFVGLTRERLNALFKMLEEKEYHLLITNFEKYTDVTNKDDLLRLLIRHGKKGHYVLLNDCIGNNEVYQSLTNSIIPNGDLSILDFSSMYLSMPDFNDVIELFIDFGFIKDEYDPLINDIKSSLPFMGFIGLNEIQKAKASGNINFISVGKKYSQLNYTSNVKAYLKRLSNQSLLIDSNWGDYSSDVEVVKTKKGEYDYDSIKGINKNNIKKILEGNFTLFQKCGLVVEYCLLGRDDISFWPKLSDEEQSERATSATKLVFQILGIFDIDPVVEVLEELSNKNAGGLCCDGGKRIQYKKEYVNNYDYFSGCILHESFHAFQSFTYSNRTPYCEWFFTELGVTRARIEEWRLNNSKYMDLTTNKRDSKSFTAYRYQIIESDANAFSLDCKRAISNNLIATIDFE